MSVDKRIYENNSNKGFFLPIIGVVLLIVAVGIGAYLLGTKKNQPKSNQTQQTTPATTPQPSPVDEAVNWKTYRNEKYNYELKYPPEWQVEEPTVYETRLSGTGLLFIIDSEVVGTGAMFPGEESKNLQLIINGIKTNATEVLYKNDSTADFGIFAGIQYDNLDYGFRMSAGKKAGTKENREKLLKILSTFKFTDQNQTTDASNRKTFNSQRCGISIQYPKEWKAIDTKLEPGIDDPGYNYGCIDLRAPDYTPNTDGYSGFQISIQRTTTGNIKNNVKITTIDDYLNSSIYFTNVTKPFMKKFGELEGKYSEGGGQWEEAYFTFLLNEKIFSVQWRLDSNSSYINEVENILKTIKVQ